MEEVTAKDPRRTVVCGGGMPSERQGLHRLGGG
jgi:hypothetical protein